MPEYATTLPIAGLFSTGRSGSTMLGAVLDAHPDIAYRFEPIHRLPRIERRQNDVFNSFDDKAAWAKDFFDRLVPGDALVEKPPFFHKNRKSYALWERLYPLARVAPPINALYRRALRWREGETIIFKEVTHEKLLVSVARAGLFPVAQLVRHPVAVAMSEVRAQGAGKLPTKRQEIIGNLLRDHRPDLHDRFGAELDGMDLFQRNILLWRMDTDSVPTELEESGAIHTVYYESICENMLPETERLLAHFRLPMVHRVREFIATLESGEVNAEGMFSVHKPPKETANKWRERVTGEQRAQAKRLLESSPAFARGIERAGWDALESP